MAELTDRVVLLTGASRGIGRALATALVAAGASTVLTVRDEAAAAELRAAFPQALIATLEITDRASIDALLALVQERFGRVDVLVNNAGVFLEQDRRQRADAISLDVLRTTLETNLFATIAMCQAFAPLVPRGGRIVNLSSTMGQLEGGLTPYATAYSVSKAALNAYTSALAAALEEKGVWVAAVHPGWVKTDMGGAGARVEPERAAEDLVWLISRAKGESGRFWWERRVIPW